MYIIIITLFILIFVLCMLIYKVLHIKDNSLNVHMYGGNVTRYKQWIPKQAFEYSLALKKLTDDVEQLLLSFMKYKGRHRKPFLTYYLYQQYGIYNRGFNKTKHLYQYMKEVTNVPEDKIDKYINVIMRYINVFKKKLDQINKITKSSDEVDLNGETFIYRNNGKILDELHIDKDLLCKVNGDNALQMYSMFRVYKSFCQATAETMQLATPPKIYEEFKEKYKITLEGFASPLNRYFDKFCSAFPEVDEPFGSIGSFFDVDINENIVCNPPFDEEVMDKAIDRLIDAMNKNEITTIFVCPQWDDSPAIIKCKECKYLKKTIKEDNSEFVMYSTDGKQNIKIPNSYIFIMSSIINNS